MQRTMRTIVIFTALFALVTCMMPGTAMAKDVAKKFGLGLDNTLTASTLGIGKVPASPNSLNVPTFGVSLKYWIDNDWGIQGVFGFAYATGGASSCGWTGDEGDEYICDPEGYWAFTLDIKGLYNFAKGDRANLAAFFTLHMRKENTTLRRPEGSYHSNLGLALALGLTPEVFITENFAIVAELGLTFRIQQGFATGISGDNLLGGFGFHYYF